MPWSIISGSVSCAETLPTLPECRWRGPCNKHGNVECNSLKILKPETGVPPELCKRCSLANHPVGNHTVALTTAPTRPAACRFRGSAIALEVCPTCNGHVQVKVFACSVFHSCTLFKPLDGHHVCDGCFERQSPGPSDSPQP